jgi:hypothetical protein
MGCSSRGEFLGMMIVLMQRRKVCNRPDLFDPRSILTPLFTVSTQMWAPGLLVYSWCY